MITLFGVLLLVGAWYVSHDVTCVSAAETWLPDYPASQVIEQVHTFLRTWGIGETARVLVSDDPADVVRSWYREHDRLLAQADRIRASGPARMRWFVHNNHQGGAVVLLFSNCTSGIVLL